MYRTAKILLVILAGMLEFTAVFAVDGDVSYTAPYLWVDPETGQVSTINPGPQPKVHTETAGSNLTGKEHAGPSIDTSAQASPDADETRH